MDNRQLKDVLTFSSITFQILKFSWHASQKPIWLWSSLPLHRKLTPAMTNGLTWCHASAAPCMLLCTRRALGNDLETECCQVNEIWPFKKWHFTSNLQKGIRSIVKAQPLNLVFGLPRVFNIHKEWCSLLILVALCNRSEKLGNGENWHSTVVSFRCFLFKFLLKEQKMPKG